MKKQRAAKRWRALIVALCTLALAVTPAFAAWGDDVSSGDMKASNQTYADGPTSHIQSFTLNNLYTYKSLGADSGKQTLALSTSALQDAVKNQLLPQWSPIAAGVFRDQASQFVDLYGYEDNSGMMSQSGFDAYFNNMTNDKYRDEKWSMWALSDKLQQTWAERKGDKGWDQMLVSGVKQVSNLAEAREMMAQQLVDCQGSNHPLNANDFLNAKDGGENERLDALNDDGATTGFVNIVTSVNCQGASCEFDYVTFGIVFYDFEAVPVAAQGLKYVTGGFTTSTDEGPAQSSDIKNGQQQEIAHSAKLGDAVTETTSTTISALASAKMSQNIGASVSWSETESSTESSLWPTDEGISGESSTESSTTTMGLNWGAAWELAGAAGAEHGHSQSKEVSKAVETTVLLPAHTAANISHATTTTTYAQTYQQPVILSYKVAIFAMSGDWSSAGAGGIYGSAYDKQSLVIKFDTKEEANTSYGCAATDDLYSRVVTNKRVNRYDVSGGRTYSTHCDKGAWSKSEDIDWDNVISAAKSYWCFGGPADVVALAKTNVFYETPGKLNVSKDKTTSDVGAIYPLYDLAKVKTPKTKYVLYTGQTLSRQALNATGYDKDNIPFYGFDPTWGEWNRCDENGTIINNGYLKDDDPVVAEDSDTLAPKPDTLGGTIYLKWVIEDAKARPKTGDSPDGQNLAAANIESPVVEIEVKNAGLNDSKVKAEGGYTGYYKNPVNLNSVITYEITDSDDRVLAVQAKWESRVPSSGYGINVNAATGIATFTEPGTYKVRPYVINNSGKAVYSDWIEITATEHDLTHYAAQGPTCDANGHIEYYKCSECGKYFSDAVGENEIAAEDVLIESAGHDWGEWTTTRRVSGDTPGEQQRVCGNDASHVESRDVYTVQFNMNGKEGTAPTTQEVPHGTSAAVPAEPKATGYTFDGWYTDPSCEDVYAYDFGERVTGNRVLYAKWNAATYMVAAMAVGDADAITITDGVTGKTWEQEIHPGDAHGSLSITNGTKVEDGAYTYYYKEVPYGANVELQVQESDSNYGLRTIQAVEVKSDASTGDQFTPAVTDEANKTYSFNMHAADVVVVASFGQVTVTYDGNAPANATAYNVPKPQKIAYGGTPKTTLQPSASGDNGEAYLFTGWYTDAKCTTPYNSNTALTKDTTLYAGWQETDENLLTVTYTLYDVAGSTPPSYEVSYKVAPGSTAYNPTNDLYAIAGDDVKHGYDLKKVSDSYWFTDKECTKPYVFTTEVTANLHLYAQIVPRQYTVSFYAEKSDTASALGTTSVDYYDVIGTLPIDAPEKPGYTLSGWATADGADWDLAKTPVEDTLSLYAKWTAKQYPVAFVKNAPADATVSDSDIPAARQADYDSKLEEPDDPTDTTGKYKFDGWYKEAACTTAWDFETDTVKGSTQLYAKWTVNSYTVKFDMQGHGTAAIADQHINHGDKATRPANDPAEEGYEFGNWYTSDDGGATLSRTAFNFNTAITKDTTLYAKWTKTQYNVIVSNLEHGTITPNSKTATQGSTVTLTVTPDDGYGLVAITVKPGTYSEQDGFSPNGGAITPVKVADGTYTFTMPYSDVEVSATFGQVTVTFDGNSPNGTAVDYVPIAQTIAYGGEPTQPNAVPTVTGYTFVGWYLDTNGAQPYLFTPLKANTILHAKWMPNGTKYHNVTYTLYGAPGSDPASYSVTHAVEHGGIAYNPVTDLGALIPENPGYELYADASGNEWFTDTYCTQPYAFATSVEKDIQLYAKVIPQSFIVSFYRNKVNGVLQNFVDAKSMNYGTSIGNNAPKLTREGYTLSGWKDAATDSEWNLSTAIIAPVTLYATWAANSYTVTFAANVPSGVAVSGMPGKQVIVYGDESNTATEPAEAPTAEGYTFDGWFTEPACTNAYDFKTAVTESLTLYAKWTKNVYRVDFDTNGAGNAPDAQNVEYGGKATDPGALTLTGYDFGGWCTDAECTTAYDFDSQVTGNLTLYAKWTASEPEVEPLTVYRVYHTTDGEHFYTTSKAERDQILSWGGWNDEGVAWVVPSVSNTPVYRVYDMRTGEHHYTTSVEEKNIILSWGNWRDEGIAWYSDDAETVPVQRLQNSSNYPHAHHYTLSKAEWTRCIDEWGWRSEGVGWYALAESPSELKKAGTQDLVAASI